MPDTKTGLRIKRLAESRRLIPTGNRILPPDAKHPRPRTVKVELGKPEVFYKTLQDHVGKELTQDQWLDLNTNKWKKYITGALDCSNTVRLVLNVATPPKVKELLIIQGDDLQNAFNMKVVTAPWDEGRREFVVS
jgi:hypothetical protein